MAPDLNAIRERLRLAAPGPWAAGGDDDSADGRMFIHDTRGHALFDSYEADWADIDFAAHARADVPALLALVHEAIGVALLAEEQAMFGLAAFARTGAGVAPPLIIDAHRQADALLTRLGFPDQASRDAERAGR